MQVHSFVCHTLCDYAYVANAARFGLRLLDDACRVTLCFVPVSASQRDGCPKIINLGSAKTDLFYERK